MKQCTECNQIKSLELFHHNKNEADGHSAKCAAYVNAVKKAYRAAHPEVIAAQKREYNRQHPEKNRERARRYYERNKDNVDFLERRCAISAASAKRCQKRKAATRVQI